MQHSSFASFMSVKKVCALCDEEVPVIALQAHTARCLIAIGIVFRNEPYCTCPSCQGYGSHPGPSRLPPERRQVEPLDFDDAFDDHVSPPPPSPQSIALLGSQMTGKRCYFCKSTTQPPKHYPLMRIGRYYGARFCCGKHYNPGPDVEASKAALRLFSLHSLIDQPPDSSSNLALFDDGSPHRQLNSAELVSCSGDGTGSYCPDVPRTGLSLRIWDAEKNQFNAFCTTDHMWSFFGYKHLKKKTKKARKSKNGRKRKRSRPNEEDESTGTEGSE